MTATSRPWRASKDVQPHRLGTALRGLGLALGTSATPRREFQRDLRERLLEEARLIALQPKPPPRSRRPKRPRGPNGGGIRLAAIGISFSLAGGGMVAAAHSHSLPANAGDSARQDAPATSVTSLPARARGPGPATGRAAGTATANAGSMPALAPPAALATPTTSAPVAAPSPPASALTSVPALPTASAVPTPRPPALGGMLAPPLTPADPTAPPQSLVPTGLFPASSLSPAPSPSHSPLG